MKKITLKLLLICTMVITSFTANAQFGCATAVPISDGYTAAGIVSPGNGGPEDWNTNPTGTSINGSYWDDDAYAFTYTAGAQTEAIEMVIFTRKTWNGVGIFTTCDGTTFSGELDAVGSGTSSNIEQTVSAILEPEQTVYIIVGQWGTPNALDFDVVSFSAEAITVAPDCVAVTTPSDDAEGVNVEGVFTWAAGATATGYYINLGTTPGGTEILDMEDLGNVTSYDIPGSLEGDTEYYLSIIPYNGNGNASDCTEVSFTTSTPPANNECDGAQQLTVNAALSCDVVTSGTTVNASQSMIASPCFGNPNDDVWFQFTATSTAHVVTLSNITAVSGTSTDMYFQVLSGTCGDLVSMLCSDPNSNQVNGLTAGENYFVRVYSYGTTSRQTFNICITTPPPPPPPPANDNCSGAVSLTVNDDFDCAVVTSGTTVGALQSMAATPCYGNPDDDVWFSFEATSVAHRIVLSNIVAVEGSGTDMYMQVLSGTCGDLTSVQCSDPQTMNVTGLTIGNTYFVRVYSYSLTARHTFDICIGTPPSPPANDDFANATPVSCGTLYTGDTTYATLDQNDAPDGFGADMDAPNVWFSFTGTDGNGQTVTLNLCNSSYDTSVLVYTGTPGDLTLIAANDDDATCGTGLTTRSRVSFNSDGVTTYYIAVEGYNSSSTGAFTMDVTCEDSVPPAVENQACSSSEQVFVDGVAVTSDNTNGTVNPNQPSCDSFGSVQDVWFLFTAPASGEVDVEVSIGTMTSGNFNVYSGVCDTLVPVAGACNSNFTATATEALSGLVAGDTYYVQVWSSAAEEGTFTLTLSDPTLNVGDFNSAAFKYFPNPVTDVLQITHTSTITQISVYNMLGQQVISRSANASETTVDMSALPAGTYVVKATAENVAKTFRVVKE